MSIEYKTPEGEQTSLHRLCRSDPEWAASRIRFLAPIARAQAVAVRALGYYQHPLGNADCQVDMCIEECSKLTKALLKLRRYPSQADTLEPDVREELADVMIMTLQMMRLFGWSASMDALDAKTVRLEERVGIQRSVTREKGTGDE